MENKKNPLVNLIREEWKYLGKRRKTFIFYMSLFVVSGIIELLTPLIIGFIFNLIQQTVISDREFKKLIFMIFLIFILQIIFWLFHGTARIMEQLTGFFVHRNYTNSKINKILELPVKWHKDNHSGDTIDKLNRGRNSLDDFSESTYRLVYVILHIFGALIILFFVDFKIALFALIFSLLVLFGTVNVDTRLRVHYKDLNKFSNKLGASIFDYLSNIMTVITLRLKKTVEQEIDEKVMASYPTSKKVVLIDEIKWAFATLAITLMIVLVLAYKSYTDYKSTGTILIGTLFILYSYLKEVGNSFFRFGELYGEIVRRNARIEGVYPIDEEFEKLGIKTSGQLPSNWKEIEIRNLNFTYDEEWKKNHLKDVNLKFKRGDKIALIGESGSGKSTVLALMRGLYPPNGGKIYCDGKELERGFVKVKRSTTLIPQEPEIFNNTIKYNITMDLKVKKEELEKAIEIAQFKKVVDRLNSGLDTNVLEKGVSLSGGEKQRLALARGLLAAKNSDIILLDEPTSSVDSLNEKKIHENIFKKFKDKTIICSIHRLHLLDNFDYIYMFEKGKIIAEGTLKEIKNNSRFRYIWSKYGMTKEIK